MQNSEVNVLVTGVGGGSLGRELMKAFKMSNNKYRIIATDMLDNSVGLHETSISYVIPPASSSNYIDSLLKICKKENVHAIAAGSEQEIEKVSKNIKVFEEAGIKVLSNPWNVIELCMDKFTLTNFFAKKNILCPKSFLFQEDNDVDKIESYPVIIKPRTGSGSRNVFIAHDKQEAVFFANYLIKYGSEPLIQEYIGSHKEEFTIGVLYADEGKLVTSIAMKRILEGGLSTRQIVIIPETKEKFVVSSGISQGLFEDFKEIRLAGEKIAKSLEANGPINIQCRKTDSGIFPFEVNPRFSGTTGARSLVGHNEPDIFCRYRLFNEIPENVIHKNGYVVKDFHEKYIAFEDAKNVPRI